MKTTKHSHVQLHIEREEIEITRDGMFGGPVDYYRKFIPGLPYYYMTVGQSPRVPITHEQAVELRTLIEAGDENAIHAWATPLLPGFDSPEDNFGGW